MMKTKTHEFKIKPNIKLIHFTIYSLVYFYYFNIMNMIESEGVTEVSHLV